MFREMIEYCLTPASFHARRTGYLYEAIAFESRARRNEKEWRPHWKTCHQLIETFCQKHSEAKSLAIFGSGCLFEIPKPIIQSQFEKIILIDQVFPRSVRAWAAAHSDSVELRACDLNFQFPNDLKVDLAFSANLFSQLSLLRPEKRSEVQNKHLRDLKSLSCPVLLWTDYEKIFKVKDSKEVLHRQETSLVEIPNVIANWVWNLALAPEIDPEIDVILQMSAHAF
jgi:hypothetical protein